MVSIRTGKMAPTLMGRAYTFGLVAASAKLTAARTSISDF